MSKGYTHLLLIGLQSVKFLLFKDLINPEPVHHGLQQQHWAPRKERSRSHLTEQPVPRHPIGKHSKQTKAIQGVIIETEVTSRPIYPQQQRIIVEQPVSGYPGPYPGATAPYPPNGPYMNNIQMSPMNNPIYPPAGQPIMNQPIVQGQPMIEGVRLNPYNTGYMIDPNLMDVPCTIKCPFCGFVGPTLMNVQPGAATWGWCVLMTFFTGCCCIPFCIDSCQDKMHYCSRCGAQVGAKIATMC